MQNFSSTQDVDTRTTRSIDSSYVDRPPASNPRPYFPFVWSHILPELSKKSSPALVDIGSANGAFLHYCHNKNPNLTLVGIDALSELVAFSQKEVPQVNFVKADISSRSTLPAQKFDIATMLTLHSHFDDPMDWLPNTMNLVKQSGQAYVFGPFNKAPIDTLVRLRRSNSDDRSWLPGWNLFSRRSIEDAILSIDYKFRFHEYPTQLAPSSVEDHLSTRNVCVNDKQTYANDAGLILDFALLQIYR